MTESHGGEGGEFSLPSIPYFYHDVVARIVPGLAQAGALLASGRLHGAPWASDESIQRLSGASAVILSGALLSAAYLLGVVWEGLAVVALRIKEMVVTRPSALAYEAIFESYEPLAPHFFARGTRFLAEAKMLLFSAVAMPQAYVVLGLATGDWSAPGGWRPTLVAIGASVVLCIASWARLQRRGLEIRRCVRYLSALKLTTGQREQIDSVLASPKAGSSLPPA